MARKNYKARTKTKNKAKRYVVLEPLQQKRVNEGILAAAKEWHVDLGDRTSFCFDRQSKALLGNKLYGKSAHRTYVGDHGKALWLWCARIGDYSSMLLLLTPLLKHVPAMKLETITSYMHYKKMPEGTVCTPSIDGNPVMDVNTKTVIKCDGKWHCNSVIKVFGSAVSRFHVTRDHTGQYFDVCKDCVELKAKDPLSAGCFHHQRRGEPRLDRRGNVTISVHFKDCMDGFIDGTWHASGNDALRPRDVRACGTYLLAAASLPFLAAYVLILIAIRLFLRSDEVINLSTTESFLSPLFIRKNGRIHALAVKVKGKCDGDWKYYYLWMDDKYPSICPVRHLLIYV